MNEAFLPNVILGGAPKCGTSSLYFWLAAHPDCFGSPKKETFFFADAVNRFNVSANSHNHPVEAYQSFFKAGIDRSVRSKPQHITSMKTTLDLPFLLGSTLRN